MLLRRKDPFVLTRAPEISQQDESETKYFDRRRCAVSQEHEEKKFLFCNIFLSFSDIYLSYGHK